MGRTGASSYPERARRLAHVAAAVVVAGGATTLLGWLLRLPRLTHLLDGGAPIRPITGCCLVVAGGALWGVAGRRLDAPTGRARRLACAAALLVASLGALTLLSWQAGFALRFDDALVPRWAPDAGPAHGRMSPATAIGLLLSGLALAGVDLRLGRVAPAGWLAGAAAAIGALAVNGYLLDPRTLQQLRAFASMSLPTAALLVVLGVGTLAARPGRGVVGLLVSRDVGGAVARALLPVALLLPAGLSLLAVFVERAEWFQAELDEATFGLVYAAAFASFVVFAAKALQRTDLRRREAEQSLRRSAKAREEMQAQLVESARLAAVGTLAAGVAHEINNPLAYLTAGLQFARDEWRELGPQLPAARAREVEHALDDALDGAARVRDIVAGMKTFSRAPADVRVCVDLEEAVDASIRLTMSEIRLRARLVREQGVAPLVLADAGRLGQVVVNLLVNAAQAIQGGRASEHEIRVVTGTDGEGWAFVEVRDTGPGIAPEVRERIFDPFFTTKPIGAGTGLGLSISRNIVLDFGGEITVETGGRGSAFRVRLPPAPPGVAIRRGGRPPPG